MYENAMGDIWKDLFGKPAANLNRIVATAINQTGKQIYRTPIVGDITKTVANTSIGKEIVRVTERATSTVIAPTFQAVASGDYIKAASLVTNPITAVATTLGANRSIVNATRALSPISATQITDPRLKEKVLGAYAIAAVVAAAIISAPVGGTFAASPTAAAPGVTAAGVAQGTAAAVATTGSAIGIGKATGLIKTPELPNAPSIPSEEVSSASMFGGSSALPIAIVGAAIIGGAVLIFGKK